MLLAKELVISSLINNQSTFPLQLTSNIDFSPDSEAYFISIYIYIFFQLQWGKSLRGALSKYMAGGTPWPKQALRLWVRDGDKDWSRDRGKAESWMSENCNPICVCVLDKQCAYSPSTKPPVLRSVVPLKVTVLLHSLQVQTGLLEALSPSK